MELIAPVECTATVLVCLPIQNPAINNYVSTMSFVMAGNRCISQLLTLHFIREL